MIAYRYTKDTDVGMVEGKQCQDDPQRDGLTEVVKDRHKRHINDE